MKLKLNLSKKKEERRKKKEEEEEEEEGYGRRCSCSRFRGHDFLHRQQILVLHRDIPSFFFSSFFPPQCLCHRPQLPCHHRHCHCKQSFSLSLSVFFFLPQSLCQYQRRTSVQMLSSFTCIDPPLLNVSAAFPSFVDPLE